MNFTIDLSSPERAWQPFLDWLNSQGVDPSGTTAVTINPDTMSADVTLMKTNSQGQHYVTEGGDIAKTIKQIRLTSLPPRRSMAARDSG
jgi:hypothetical protein